MSSRGTSPVVDWFDAVAEASAQACTSLLRRQPARTADRAIQARQRLAIWRLKKDYAQVAGGTLPLETIFQRIAGTVSEMSSTLILWVDAAETMIHEVENLYGPALGQGVYKAEQVKAALVYLLERADARLPKSLLIVQGGALEIIVDWVIDGVVLLLNRRNLWQLSGEDQLRMTRWFRLRLRIVTMALGVFGRFYDWFIGRAAMLPQVRAIADRTLEQEHGNLLLSVRDAGEFAVWFIENRRQLLAILDMVATATVEAEAFVEMSGPEKQRYARELVLMTIDEASGVRPISPLWREISATMIDFAIDVVVRIFNKRGLFGPRSASDRPVQALVA